MKWFAQTKAANKDNRQQAEKSKPRRTIAQGIIAGMYYCTKLLFSLSHGLDMGYLHYRKLMRDMKIVIENERELKGELSVKIPADKRMEFLARTLAEYEYSR